MTLLITLLIAANNLWALNVSCNDFSGVYFTADQYMPNCIEATQTGCETYTATEYMRVGNAVYVATDDFITDGVLRRDKVEPTAMKAISYDGNGNQVYISVDDDGEKLNATFEKMPNGDLKESASWIYTDGSRHNFVFNSRKMNSLAECKKLINF